jgi:hypothetical protein
MFTGLGFHILSLLGTDALKHRHPSHSGIGEAFPAATTIPPICIVVLFVQFTNNSVIYVTIMKHMRRAQTGLVGNKKRAH